MLFSVAFTECISCERIKQSPLKKILGDNPGLEDYPDEVLALGLMYGKVNVDCEWYLHCQVMPSSIDTPLFWSDSAITSSSATSLSGRLLLIGTVSTAHFLSNTQTYLEL